MHLINFTFTLLDEVETRNSAAGNHTLAILKASKTYDDLQNGLSDLAQEIEYISEIQYNDEMIEIEYYLMEIGSS